MNPELSPDPPDTRRRTVIKRREHETDPNLVERLLGHQRYRRNIYPERRQQVRTSRFTTRRAITMLRHRQASARDHKRRRGGNIERLRATRSRPRSVDETLVLRNHTHSARAQSFSHSRQLIDRLALGSQCNERSGDLRVRRISVKQSLEQIESFIAAEILAAYEAYKKVS
jgi:hypothetical protein